jgi:hypothetical protein
VSRFIIKSAQTGAVELRKHLPAGAATVRCLTDAAGNDEFWCARLDEPVKYRFPAEFSTEHCQPEFLGRDAAGPFLWVGVVVVHARTAGQRLHPGMRNLSVDLAYVTDLTLGQDAVLDPAKVTRVAVAELDDSADASPEEERPAADAVRDGGPAAPRAPARRRLVSPEVFDDELGRMVAAVATLCGQHPGSDVPVRARSGQGPLPAVRVYDIGADSLRYYSQDPTDRWGWRSTNDPDELLYWILDDIVRNLAWAWAQKAPSYKTLPDDRARMLLVMTQWHSLMSGLRYEWGVRAGETIRRLVDPAAS